MIIQFQKLDFQIFTQTVVASLRCTDSMIRPRFTKPDCAADEDAKDLRSRARVALRRAWRERWTLGGCFLLFLIICKSGGLDIICDGVVYLPLAGLAHFAPHYVLQQKLVGERTLCFLELDTCRYRQNPNAPWAVRAFLEPFDGSTADEQADPGVRPSRMPRDVSFTVEYADNHVMGPSPLVTNRWVEFGPRLRQPDRTPVETRTQQSRMGTIVARVGIRAHSLDHYCDSAEWVPHASGGVMMRFPTSDGMMIVEAGPLRALKPTEMPAISPKPEDYERIRSTAKSQPAVAERPVVLIPVDWKPGLHPALLGGVLPVMEHWHRSTAAAADKDITLCTQMDTMGLKYLIRLAEEWAGPISVARTLWCCGERRGRTQVARANTGVNPEASE